MPWTTPIPLAAGAVLTAGAWDTNTVDNVEFSVRKPAAYASMSASQSVNSTNLTTFATLQVNNLQVGGTGDDPTLTSYQLIPQVSGLYRIELVVTWPANATGQRVIRLKHQGNVLTYDIKQAVAVNGGAGALQNTTQSVWAYQICTAADVVIAEVAQDSGSSLSVQGNTFMAMELLRIS